MFKSTVSHLKCPRLNEDGSACGAGLELTAVTQEGLDIRTGYLECRECGSRFPILAGVAVVVDDVGAYLANHVKGISKTVADREIPAEFESDYLEAKAELEAAPMEHIEEDLEAERVNALYLMTHYLRVKGSEASPWWQPPARQGSPLIDSLIREYWDQGPFARIEQWVGASLEQGGRARIVELGCGVGGLYAVLKSRIDAAKGSYLGIDSAFASIALARHFGLGAPYSGSVAMPADLLQGTVSREVSIPLAAVGTGSADFVVGDVEGPPLAAGNWDISVALNMIDMLSDPALLPRLQYGLLSPGGLAIQSGPYIWHDQAAALLREELPVGIRDSASAVEWLYRQSGFAIEETVEHLPWLFFKHLRQLEIYSVHLLRARKNG